jgi:hypothetical protein
MVAELLRRHRVEMDLVDTYSARANSGFLRVFLTFCNPAGAALRNFGEKTR